MQTFKNILKACGVVAGVIVGFIITLVGYGVIVDWLEFLLWGHWYKPVVGFILFVIGLGIGLYFGTLKDYQLDNHYPKKDES